MKNENKAYYKNNPFETAKGQNGMTFVLLDSVRNDTCNVSGGNSKTGENVGCFNLPIEYTCDRHCDCYKTRACYASGGCYSFAVNQATYSENMAFFLANGPEKTANAIIEEINAQGWQKFRYFTCGDIANALFFQVMVNVAIALPTVRFWTYTKKYSIVNSWIKNHGNSADALPENLTIVFSHWMNDDGSYFPMYNPYNLPTSEFIPAGKEYLIQELHITHICPCSDPDTIATCDTCDYPCYKLKTGESMALKEHSTTRTKDRDRAVKAAHDALKKQRKAG